MHCSPAQPNQLRALSRQLHLINHEAHGRYQHDMPPTLRASTGGGRFAQGSVLRDLFSRPNELVSCSTESHVSSGCGCCSFVSFRVSCSGRAYISWSRTWESSRSTWKTKNHNSYAWNRSYLLILQVIFADKQTSCPSHRVLGRKQELNPPFDQPHVAVTAYPQNTACG